MVQVVCQTERAAAHVDKEQTIGRAQIGQGRETNDGAASSVLASSKDAVFVNSGSFGRWKTVLRRSRTLHSRTAHGTIRPKINSNDFGFFLGIN